MSDGAETESDCCWALDCAAGMLEDDRDENKLTLKIFSKSSLPGDFWTGGMFEEVVEVTCFDGDLAETNGADLDKALLVIVFKSNLQDKSKNKKDERG